MMSSNQDLISEIIKLELEITTAIINGHKPHENDEFKLHRELLKAYRNILLKDGKERRNIQ